MIFADGISQRKLALNCGCGESTIRNLIAKGLIVRDDNCKVSASLGVEAYQKYQQQKIENTKEKSKNAAKHIIEKIEKIKNTEVPDNQFDSIYQTLSNNVEIDPIGTLNIAKAYMTMLQTKEQKMKVDEMEQRLVPVERVNHDAEEVGALIRSKLITVPARVATLCEGRSARDIEDIINNEINKALEELQKLMV